MANSISSALLVATSGLKAAQAGIDVVTRNVSGSQVEGFTRKSANLTSLALADTNSGVRALEVTRNVNTHLLRQLRVMNSATERLGVEDDFLGRLETIFGKPGDDITITARIGNLADAFRALSVSPDLGTSQFKVLSAAETMANNLNQVSSTIRGLREEADNAIGESVTIINDALAVVQDLNLQISTLRAQGKSTAELEDQRDNQINTIAKEIDISYFERENGEILISTKAGRALLDASYDRNNPPISFIKTPVILPGSAYYPPAASGLGGGLSGVKIGGLDITQELVGGRIAGYLNIRDEFLPATESQLDELAAQMIQKFNFNDLQLFTDGSTPYPSNLSTDGTLYSVNATGPSTITLGTGQTTTGTNIANGMTMKFPGDDQVYEITSFTATTVTFERVGGINGLAVQQPAGTATNIMFGPAIPNTPRHGTAGGGAVGDGATAATALQISSTVGLAVGTRIKFANHDTIYTVGSVIANAAGTEFTVIPDGGGTGLQAAVSNSESISVLHPVPNIGGLSSRLQVNSAVTNNPWRVRDGTRVDTPSTLTGSNELPLDIISMFEGLQSFTKNTGLSTSATFEAFAASAVSFQAVRRQAVSTEQTSQTLIRDNFDQRLKNDSGVNVDQELAFMLEVQNSYAASARVITAIKEMLDELLRIG